MKRFVLPTFLLSFVLTTGCATSTVIRSEPSGAIVRNARGEKVGKTPFPYSSGGVINSTETFTVEKPGFEQTAVTVRRDQVNGWAMAGFIIPASLSLFGAWPLLPLAIGTLWAADFQPVYTVELEPVPAAEGGEAAAEVVEQPRVMVTKKSKSN